MSFFEAYPRFFSTSKTAAVPERLAKRHHVLIERNQNLIEGKRILDIASHDGRWSFAAVKAGASHIVGIEARQHLAENAVETFKEYRIPSTKFRFLTDDIFARIDEVSNCIDTVFCFGFLYHTLRHAELFAAIRKTGAKHVIVDSTVIRSLVPGAYIEIKYEDASDEGNGIVTHGARMNSSLVGHPTIDAIGSVLRYFGYAPEVIDWKPYLGGDLAGVTDYAEGTRVTVIGSLNQD